MKEDKTKVLLKKYKEGYTTLDDEQFLLDKTSGITPSLDAWSTFVKNNKIETPHNFNEKLWESFQNKKNRKRKVFVGIMSAAASLLLFITFIITNQKQEELNYSEKEALLSLAKEMVSNSDSTDNEKNIIYENDMVIIYTTKE
ncbi:hypothetical protein HNV10_11750 [Winogradskyella litoriviva]|uniref:Uncharacterized protein n=1 Tax=Winogradskyella litoriviva TaxID=1220182 RepID=A0ABX2E720_9FLAO|nr:hypothetical protein [Winogradskyella litoriviva]NRD23922.1 hypothetical protein [Winogradskyella litoriviva]